MSRTSDSAARCPEHDEQPIYEEQALEDQLTQEQFNKEVQNDIEVMLTQEQCDEEEGPEGEAAEGKEEEDDDDDDSESPEDPFPREARRRPTEEDLDKNFDPNEEVGKKSQLVNFAKTLAVLHLLTL